MNDTIDKLGSVERLAIFRSLKVGHQFLFVGPNTNEFATFVKFDDGSAKALDDIMLPKGTICEFEHDETVHLLQTVRVMEENLFNSTKYQILPGIDLIISGKNNPENYKSIGKAEIVILEDHDIVRVHAKLGISTNLTEEDFNLLKFSQLNRKIGEVLDENVIDKVNTLHISPILQKIKF